MRDQSHPDSQIPNKRRRIGDADTAALVPSHAAPPNAQTPAGTFSQARSPSNVDADPGFRADRATADEAEVNELPARANGARFALREQPASAQTPSIAAPEAPDMVEDGDHEVFAMPGHAPTSGRKSTDLSRATGPQHPGLPSPAPSDENMTSPTLAESQLAQRRARPPLTQFRPPAVPHPGVGQRPTLPASPAITRRVSPFARRANTLPPGCGHPAAAPPSQHLPAAQSLLGQHPVPTLRNMQVASGLNAPNPAVRTPPVLPSHGSQVRLRSIPASRVPDHVLLQRLEAWDPSRNPAARGLSSTDHGRIMLLRDAVQRGDWFYQILSQLYCLRTVDPDSVPRSMQNIPGQCYAHVETLLCPNARLNPELVKMFANFPESVMGIYSDQEQGARMVYEQRMERVRAFLLKLPELWDPLVAKAREDRTAPLVQDLVDCLGMQSAVLQTTTFRAVARVIYGVAAQDALAAVEAVHHIDQDTYYSGWYRRNDAEKRDAQRVFRRVHDAWVAFQRNPGPGGQRFQLPHEVTEWFRQPPANIRQMQQHNLAQHARNMQQHVTASQGQQPQQLLQAPNQLLQNSPVTAQPPYPMSQLHYQPGLMAPTPLLGRHLHDTRSLGAQPQRRPGLIYPPTTELRPQPTHPNPDISALHQARVRSPDLGPRNAELGAPVLYRHVIGFGVPPTKLSRTAAQSIRFTITDASWKRLAQVSAPQSPSVLAERRITEDSLLYRLRCSVVPSRGFATASTWVTADNFWPEELSFQLCNKDDKTSLETRRKLHHGRYFPVDLTPHLRKGVNELRVFNIRPEDNGKRVDYAIAVEVIGVATHNQIKEQAERIPTEKSLQAVTRSLSGGDPDGDEIAMVSSTLSIKLFDPYSGCKIFDIPARGSGCLHKDCFDLETFLSLRTRKHPGWPSVVDCWRCPLCRGDVRPQMLVVDEFLLGVRAKLEEQGLLDTREITIDVDGTWRPKVEERSGIRSPSLEREEQATAAVAAAATAEVAAGGVAGARPAMQSTVNRVIEVIELD